MRTRQQFICLAFLLGGVTLSGELYGQEPDIKAAYHASYEYERAEDYQDGIRALAPVYEAYPNGYTVNLRMGWLFYLNGNYNNAISHYDVARSAAPFALEPKLVQLLPMLAQGRWSDAESVAYEVVSVDHYNYYGNMRLVFALRMQEKFEPAYQIALKMAAVYPTDVAFLTELALLNQARGYEEEAARLFTDVQILDPENEAARNYFNR